MTDTDKRGTGNRSCILLRYLPILLLMLLGGTASGQVLNLARNELAAEQAVAALILADIYERAGLKMSATPMPAARANHALLAGKVDGEVARVQSYADKNPSLIKVEPSYYQLTTVAYARSDSRFSINSQEDLLGYRVGIVRGIVHAEVATSQVSNVIVVSNYDQMYEMLRAGRIDVAIDTGANGAYMISKLGMTDIRPAGTLARLDLFHILHPSRRDLVPRLQSVIRRLKDTRQLDKLSRQHELQFLESGMTP
jgi:ABC-type amino acid transport substrate-binding protein